MPNGAYSPQCANCDNFVYREDRRFCKLYDFVMPFTGWQLICSDWQHEAQSYDLAKALEPGQLYAYSYNLAGSRQSLGSFSDLQTTVVGLTAHDDTEFGWVIYIDRTELFTGLEEAIVNLDDQDHHFTIVESERTHATGGTRLPDDTWKVSYTTKKHKMLVSPSNRLLLYHWLNTYFDMPAHEEFIKNHIWSENVRSGGVSIFMKELERPGYVSIFPDFVQHLETFQRNRPEAPNAS